ncbi:unnamed protein product [Moneuplotes crassus]|uniref:Glutathione S-transferase n=1 Tax=Euplotes crassus TaxID=5936 RepID=A0AAD1XVV4_EUPCR|nr:unnamed protein product [Moneuplotes crassus]
MVKLVFHGNVLSPPARTPLWVLKTLGVEHEFKHVAIFTESRSEEYTSKVNVFGQVPALEVDGTFITQSSTIIRYLANEFDKDGIILPSGDHLERAKAEEILDIGATTVRMSTLKAIGPIFAGPKYFGLEKVSEEEEKKLIEEVQATFGKLNTKLGDKPYFTGDKLTVGDVYIFNDLQTTQFILKIDLSDHPQLNAWYETVSKDEIVAELSKEMFDIISQKE